jgi:NAD+ synthetase
MRRPRNVPTIPPIHVHDQMRIALAQVNPTVGDIAGNLAQVMQAMDEARRQGAQALVTSELAIVGYPPRDLLLRHGVVEACETAVQRVANAAGDLYVIAGHPRRCPGGTRPLRNSASVCHAGQVLAVCDKQLLPGYDVFDEDRYFEPGDQSLVIEIGGVRCGLVICEDLWRATDVTVERTYPSEPVAELAKAQCQLIIALNASPFVVGKWQKHLRQLSEIASQFHVPLIAVNQVGANDDLIFDGRSVVVAPGGHVAEVLAGFEPDLRVIDVPMATRAPNRAASRFGQADAEIERWSAWPREVFHALSLGIREYCVKTNHRDVHVGLSGGVDSALVAALASSAIGSKHVHGVMMPSRYSSPGSIDDAKDLAERLGLGSLRTMPIAAHHQDLNALLARTLGKPTAGITDENLQARLRGVFLMAISNDVGGLVLATSNKSEMAVGYSTLYGDMCGAIAPLGDLTKTRIYELSRWINTNFRECGFDAPPIPQNSIDKPPSAELRPNQTDQDTLPPYDLLDQIIERRIELEQSEAAIIAESGIEPAIVRKSLSMIDRPQYKRDQAPVVLKVTGRAFGRGRPMPIVMRQTETSDQRSDGADEPAGENLSIARANLP